jgi:hypothetical protein
MDGIKENPEIADKLSLVLRGEKFLMRYLARKKRPTQTPTRKHLKARWRRYLNYLLNLK